jgi:hypothetical protein
VEGKAGKILDSDKKIIGARLSFTIIKNRIARPFTSGTIDWLFGDNNIPILKYYSGLLNYFEEIGKVEKGKGKVTIGEDSYQCRQDGVKNPIYVMEDSIMEKMLTEHPNLLER